jgi:hypothetical protein
MWFAERFFYISSLLASYVKQTDELLRAEARVKLMNSSWQTVKMIDHSNLICDEKA